MYGVIKFSTETRFCLLIARNYLLNIFRVNVEHVTFSMTPGRGGRGRERDREGNVEDS